MAVGEDAIDGASRDREVVLAVLLRLDLGLELEASSAPSLVVEELLDQLGGMEVTVRRVSRVDRSEGSHTPESTRSAPNCPKTAQNAVDGPS